MGILLYPITHHGDFSGRYELQWYIQGVLLGMMRKGTGMSLPLPYTILIVLHYGPYYNMAVQPPVAYLL